jgi:hypothetical protein
MSDRVGARGDDQLVVDAQRVGACSGIATHLLPDCSLALGA